MSRIFINYRRMDSEGYVGRLYDHLVQVFDPQNIFMDAVNIEPGADFVQALEAAVAQCDVFIAMIGPQWLSASDETGERRLDQWNDFVRLEIESAIKQNKLIIPVLVGRATMPSPTVLPEGIISLSRRHAIELSHKDFAYDIQQLIDAIKKYAPANESHKLSSDPQTTQQKEARLKKVRDDLVAAANSPLYAFRIESRAYPVIGAGNPDANILFIGESPGKTEAETGVPFCGPSGEVLDTMLASIKLRREDVYLTNVLLDRPPNNRDPLPEEIDFYTPFVDRIIDIIQPSVIVTLGRFSMYYLLKKQNLPEKRDKISTLHGKLIKTTMPYGEIHIVPLYHPAVVLYSAKQREVLQHDFEKLRLFI